VRPATLGLELRNPPRQRTRHGPLLSDSIRGRAQHSRAHAGTYRERKSPYPIRHYKRWNCGTRTLFAQGALGTGGGLVSYAGMMRHVRPPMRARNDWRRRNRRDANDVDDREDGILSLGSDHKPISLQTWPQCPSAATAGS
jgi:hypothetical protein